MTRAARPPVPGVTIYDVAAKAGVSISTVSLAMNNPDRVAAATRLRVLEAADELGFVPKAEAVSRARKGVGLVGVLAPFSSYPSYYRRLNGLLSELALADRTVDTVIFDHASAAVSGSPLLSSVPLTHRLDGLVVMGLPIDDLVAERLRTHALPTVLVDSARRDLPSVLSDDAAGGELAGERVAARGHKRVAYLLEATMAGSPVLQGDRRLQGFRRGVGRKVKVEMVQVANSAADARACAERLLEADDAPTAIVGHDDLLAAGAIQALRARGLVPGTDVDVVGFDDSDLAQALDLTTVAQPFEESGATAARLIAGLLDGTRPAGRRIELGVSLVVRSSG